MYGRAADWAFLFSWFVYLYLQLHWALLAYLIYFLSRLYSPRPYLSSCEWSLIQIRTFPAHWRNFGAVRTSLSSPDFNIGTLLAPLALGRLDGGLSLGRRMTDRD